MRTTVRKTASNGEAGFTLLEIVMVITLMALLSGIYISHAGFSVSMPEDRIILSQQENLIRARAAHLQTEAILMRQTCTLTFSSDGMTYGKNCRPMPGDGQVVLYLDGVVMTGDGRPVLKADKNGIIDSAVDITLEKKSASVTFRLTEGARSTEGGRAECIFR